MILGDVEETVTTIEIDEETYEEVISHFKFASFLKRYAQFFLMYIKYFFRYTDRLKGLSQCCMFEETVSFWYHLRVEALIDLNFAFILSKKCI